MILIRYLDQVIQISEHLYGNKYLDIHVMYMENRYNRLDTEIYRIYVIK